MSNPNYTANNKENISQNQNPARRYPCPHCPKIFSTPMAMGGHQNAHRQRREKRPIFTSQGVSGPSSSPALRMESMDTLPSFVGPVRRSPSWDCRYLQDYFARREEHLQTVRSRLSAPLALPAVSVPLASSASPASLAPPVQPKSTMFFGVPDFFKSSVAPSTPLGDGTSSSGRVVEEEEKEEEEEEEEEEE
ncbi:hypothetical protein POM88_005025 [Heracleum sosnowskyi]|uniref:C2H2-type domain-containing protein n=1 Tax=Heracleum sosnowskyi TaxID=360622 RepID=A0AAD8N891_9APIA|nr:hypothetical protein POM88_005025 [Heracleum sosnowskyi]